MQFRYRAAVAALFSVVACAQAPAALAVEHTASQHHHHGSAQHAAKRHHAQRQNAKRHHAKQQRDARRHHIEHHELQMPADYAEWSRVADCESGGWRIEGDAYPDSLGITSTNYVDFGGSPQPVGMATRAEIVAQIQVADRLIAAYHTGIPDQDGCSDW